MSLESNPPGTPSESMALSPLPSNASEPPPSRSPLVPRILLGMFLGALMGLFSRAWTEQTPAWIETLPDAVRFVLVPLLNWLAGLAQPLGILGSLIVNLIKGLAGPLLFVAVVDAFLRTRVQARSALYLLIISLTNAALAVLIGLTLSNVVRPGEYLDPLSSSSGIEDQSAASSAVVESARKIDFLGDLLGFVPTNPVQPFLENSILSIVILAVLGGAALRRVKDEQIREGRTDYQGLERLLATVYRALEVALGWVIATIPLAVLGVMARTVAQSGFRPFLGLTAYVGTAMFGLALQVLIVYQAWLILAARKPVRAFWREARVPVVYAMGASSSLATLPVTLRALDRMGVRPASARLAACVGTNLNNDGILLYEAMAVLFVAQVHRISLGIGDQLLAALSCVIAGIGIAGIPEAGLISLALVLATVGLPVEILPLLLTVDWLLSRCRAMTNVVSDMIGAVVLDRWGVGDSPENKTAA